MGLPVLRPHAFEDAGGGISITISSSTDDWVLSDHADYLASAQDYTITVNSGVVIGGTSTDFAMHLDPFAGSTVALINNGKIHGKGGLGGDALSPTSDAGGVGGVAIKLSNETATITNGSGEIHGGGGGGGGGGLGRPSGKSCNGSTNGDGGGGAGSNPTSNNANTAPTATTGQLGENLADGDGGDGGDIATAGSGGQTGCVGSGEGAGGAAGNAIDLNGESSPTFVSGGSSPELKGTVS